jgi:hypothetical protein
MQYLIIYVRTAIIGMSEENALNTNNIINKKLVNENSGGHTLNDLQTEPLLQNQYKSTKPVSSELFVAMMIYHTTDVIKERVWFSRLVDLLKEYMDKNRVSEALDTLTDWLIIDGEYGATGDGRAGYILYIDTHDGGDDRIKQLHDKYWDTIVSENPQQ